MNETTKKKTAPIENFVFGPKARMENESYEEYTNRRKYEKKLLKFRLRFGIASWDSGKRGTYTNPKKHMEKDFRKKNALRK